MERYHWQDWLTGAVGLWLIISGFMLNFTVAEGAALWPVRGNYVVAGILVCFLAIGALAAFAPWEEGAITLIGVWLVASPWVLDFGTSRLALWNAVVSGIVLAVLGIWALWANTSDQTV